VLQTAARSHDGGPNGRQREPAGPTASTHITSTRNGCHASAMQGLMACRPHKHHVKAFNQPQKRTDTSLC
jgi:hypothetical protein